MQQTVASSVNLSRLCERPMHNFTKLTTGSIFRLPLSPPTRSRINDSTSPEQWDAQQALLASIAAYTAPPQISTTAAPSAPTFSTCESTRTCSMQLATAASAASAYCTAMATRVAGGATAIGACAVQNKEPPYYVSDNKGKLCPDQADIWFQMIADTRGDACAGATVPKSFTLDNCIKGMTWPLSSSNCKRYPTFPPPKLLLSHAKSKDRNVQ